jgi:hypothetical protein
MMNHLSLLVHLYTLSTQPPQTIQKPQKNESYPQPIRLKDIHEKYDDKAKKMYTKAHIQEK